MRGFPGFIQVDDYCNPSICPNRVIQRIKKAPHGEAALFAVSNLYVI